MRTLLVTALLLFCAGRARAQRLTWATDATLYGDNTEFFTPYRTGESIIGAQFRTYLRMHTGPRTEVNMGVFGDQRSGSDRFVHPFRPILSFRFHDANSLGVLGTLIPERRHGYIEPMQSALLELTRPVEYGLQWVERRRYAGFDGFLNWQKLNVENQREVFDYGGTGRITPLQQVTLEMQLHGVHRGGQLFNAGQTVANNFVSGLGVTITDSLPWIARSSVSAYRLHSRGNIAAVSANVAPTGSGTYVRGSITPAGWFEVFGIWWKGKDFISNEGDNNYNSIGKDGAYYRPERKYLEVGLLRRTHIEGDVTFDAEVRFHQFDGGIKSISLFDSRWEYSYRLVVRAPFNIVLKPE